jgi:HK97 family phage portal protein
MKFSFKNIFKFNKKSIPLSSGQFKNIFNNWLLSFKPDANTGYIGACIDIWGIQFANAKFRVYKYSNNKEVIHKINNLFKIPNIFQTFWEIKYRWALDLAIDGNSYLLKLRNDNDELVGLYQLHPDRITTEPIGIERIDNYVYNTGVDMIKFPAKDIIHFKTIDYSNHIKGSPIISRIKALQDVEALQLEYRKKFYQQGGFLGATFTTEQKMSNENFNRALQQLKDRYGGSENAFQVALFEQGLKPIPTAYSLRDMQMTQERQLNRDEICSAFKVNKLLLGQSENIQRGNADTVLYVFYTTVIDPILNYFDEVLTNNICYEYDNGDEYYIKHDTMATRDIELNLKYYENGLRNGWLTVNEVRELEGYEPINEISLENEIKKLIEN